jgi:hypothetical protein
LNYRKNYTSLVCRIVSANLHIAAAVSVTNIVQMRYEHLFLQ